MTNRAMTADIEEVIKDAEALYYLYNLIGRGKIREEEFCRLYLTGRLEDWIEQTYKDERSEDE